MKIRHGFLICLIVASGCESGPRIREAATLQHVPLYTISEYELDGYLADLQKQGLTLSQRVERLARQNLNQPYRLYVLGEYPFELYDADPMYCLTASDCVTFVEQTYAMALADDWTSFFRTLQRLRYREGRVGFITRNHFVEADWNSNNAWLFKEVTGTLGGESQLAKPFHAKIDRAAFFLKFGIKADIPIQEFDGTYLAAADLPNILPQLATGDVLEIVKGNDKLQYVSHLGLVMVGNEGRITLIHSGKPRVAEVPLEGYVASHHDIIGVKVLRPLGNIPKRQPPLPSIRAIKDISVVAP